MAPRPDPDPDAILRAIVSREGALGDVAGCGRRDLVRILARLVDGGGVSGHPPALDLLLYVAGRPELGRARRRDLHAHLASCEACGRRRESLMERIEAALGGGVTDR